MAASREYRHTEPRWLRATLTLIAVGFVGLLIVLPVIAVFTEALRKGLSFYVQSITDPLAYSYARMSWRSSANS